MGGARAHLLALASGARPTGSAAADGARRYCARVLRDAGFAVVERPFDYSAFPGRWGTPLGGVWGGATVAIGSALARRGAYGPAATLLAASAALLALAALWLARRGVLAFPASRARGVNLECTRAGAEPRVWLVAHLDSKSQLVPMLGRVVGVVGLAAAWIVALVLALGGVAAALQPPWWCWGAVSGAGMLAALPVALTLVGTRSHGAVDNASGVSAVLAAASELPAGAPVGVLVTDAEELGMAGARAWVRSRTPAIAINCDGVDDAGAVRVMHSGRAPRRVLDALARASDGEPVDVRRLLPGVLVDSVAFADAGWETATAMRGTAATLRRVHTRRDDLAHLRGDGLDRMAHLLARAATELC